jgi:hypothetical protein
MSEVRFHREAVNQILFQHDLILFPSLSCKLLLDILQSSCKDWCFSLGCAAGASKLKTCKIDILSTGYRCPVYSSLKSGKDVQWCHSYEFHWSVLISCVFFRIFFCCVTCRHEIQLALRAHAEARHIEEIRGILPIILGPLGACAVPDSEHAAITKFLQTLELQNMIPRGLRLNVCVTLCHPLSMHQISLQLPALGPCWAKHRTCWGCNGSMMEECGNIQKISHKGYYCLPLISLSIRYW